MKTRFLILAILLLFTSSCLKRHFVEGRVEFIAVSDSTLNDSSLVFGRFYHIDGPAYDEHIVDRYVAWAENTGIPSKSDSSGYYYLMLNPGNYSFKGQSYGNTYPELVEEINNVIVKKNTKTQIDFYIGYSVE